MRRKCVVCKKLTENWQIVCGGPWHCFDGCFSTTGRDNRTEDGKPKKKNFPFYENKYEKN